MTPPTLPPSPSPPPALLRLEPLTPSSFAPFGTAISPPFSPKLALPPTSSTAIPPPLHPHNQPLATLANQNSALKTSPISAFTNNYPANPPSKPQMTMFSCFPRNLSGIGMTQSSSPTTTPGQPGELAFNVAILERHPFTTQTFCPLGLSADDSSTAFLVVVAPSLLEPVTASLPDGSPRTIPSPPDLSRLRAFVARGDQAVTYAPGTWHAPMVVLGSKRVDFLVTQFVNGVAEDDCQEVLLGKNGVAVRLKGLGLGLEGSATGGRAKL